MKGTVIILNGIKYFIVSTIVLLSTAFVLTSCGGDDSKDMTGSDTVTAGSEDNSEITSDTENTNGSADETQTATGTVQPDPDPEGADNTWAMFLVNEQNPLPRGYDTAIETELVQTTYRDYYMDSRMAQYMRDMIDAAANDGIDLIVSSAFRDFQYQRDNFDNSVKYRMDEGMSYAEAYADTLLAVQRPGQSEHNAGLAADILSNEYQSMDDDGFENTEAFAWLSEHAEDYGFVLRYPKGKTDVTNIIYEPWHYRFVGVYYAKDMNAKGMCMEEYFADKGWLNSDGTANQHTVYDRNSDMKLSEYTYTTENVDAMYSEDENNSEEENN